MGKLIHCKCGCKYNPDSQFYVGYYIDGTTSTTKDGFVITGAIPKGECPVCRQPLPHKEKE